ncbi:amino acid ABC transporter permease [Mesorhizobium sp. 1M-11]|uniref:amino acid ABC transporter permease n=1 Tax=Mesorhizobium sp. 1M-11 TaxID=1529006 RepID=UPI0006C73DE1|nr:amino acid ABC transporter permease [Mesorhizobium sp. 1M-11]
MNNFGWDFSSIWKNAPYLLRGFEGTLILAAVCLVLGTLAGLLLGIALSSNRKVVRLPAQGFIGIFRNTPSMVQLLWIYYALPVLIGMQLTPFIAAVIAFSLYSASYIAGIFKGGIASISKGQYEAARSLALSRWQTLRLVVLPQAVRKMIPPFANQAMEIIKLTTIASLIAYSELVLNTKNVADQEFRPIEAYTTLAIFFSLILIPLAYLTLYLERRFSK